MQRRVFGALIGCLIFAQAAWALDSARLQEIFSQHRLDPSDLGIIIEDETGQLYALNETKKLKPASLTKILTAGAALEYLGPTFVFRTELLGDGPVVNHHLKGSLYLRASGDPEFDKQKLYSFLSALKSQGIRYVDGNIIVDDSGYSDIQTRNWKSSYLLKNNQNYPLFVNVDPPAGLVAGSRKWRNAERRLRRLLDLNDEFVVYQNMPQPDLWTGEYFSYLLKTNGIRVAGKLKRGIIPEQAEVLGAVSNPLPNVIREMLKSSNNFYADMLIRTLASETGEKPATVKAGMEFIYTFLDGIGIAREEYFVTCGAGFTHNNFITAGALARVLNHLRNESSFSATFLASLPVAGIDGTLKFRMKRTAAQGRVHAKTGYLGRLISKFRSRDGVVGLGGYVDSWNGKVFTFVFIYNGKKSATVVRSMFDKICVELVEHPFEAMSSGIPAKRVSRLPLKTTPHQR